MLDRKQLGKIIVRGVSTVGVTAERGLAGSGGRGEESEPHAQSVLVD